jgi:hypothetical protein
MQKGGPLAPPGTSGAARQDERARRRISASRAPRKGVGDLPDGTADADGRAASGRARQGRRSQNPTRGRNDAACGCLGLWPARVLTSASLRVSAEWHGPLWPQGVRLKYV